jgi:Protein of unknown function (DUF2958)
MKLLTTKILSQLLKNGQLNREASAKDGNVPDFEPVVKLCTPNAQCTWLLTEINPDDQDTAFGLCDLGLGTPELGCVSLSDLASMRNHGLPVERDLYFNGDKRISRYADDANRSPKPLDKHIVEPR